MYEYQLRIIEDSKVLPGKLWSNFIDRLSEVHRSKWITSELIRDALAAYNAVIVPGNFIYFFTDQDRTLFTLKFA